MDNPGPFALTFGGSAFSITGPGTLMGDVIEGFAGLTAASFQANFVYGGGGAGVTLYIQTSLDTGNTWFDVAAIALSTANAVEGVNLSGLTPRTAPAALPNLQLTPGTCIDGMLGDRFRAVVIVTGTYTGQTLLAVSGMAR